MKKIILMSVVASSMMFAGGAIAPVEAVAPVASDSGVYVGIGYNDSMTVDKIGEFDNISLDWEGKTFLAGYQFNKYFATEVRYLKSSGDAHRTGNGNDDKYGASIKSLGLYVKGMYPIMTQFGEFTPYAYGGFARTTLRLDSNPSYFNAGSTTRGLGIGLSYAVTDELSVFVDYMWNNIGPHQPEDYWGWNGDSDLKVTTFGITYKFSNLSF